MSISFLVAQFFNIIYLLLFVAILLSWFPNINWSREPFYSLKRFSELFFEPFRRIIPPLGMLDVSPIVCFLFLEIVRQLCFWILRNLGL